MMYNPNALTQPYPYQYKDVKSGYKFTGECQYRKGFWIFKKCGHYERKINGGADT